jgi:regulator of sirC expression with transglutaminase-like and TPR domain
MPWSPRAVSPLEYFAALVQGEGSLPLLEAAACLAHDDYPRLDVQQVLADVDVLTARLRRRLPSDATALHKIRLLNHFFFDELHFRGNENDYYDVDNSYPHRVLDRRLGIPVSLALVWVELARGLGLQAHGVGFPGHFLIRVQLPQGQVFIDPFDGESLGREQLQERLDHWRTQHGLGEQSTPPLGQHLLATPEREVLARMLRNLKEIHRQNGHWQRFVAVQDRLILLQPQAWAEYRDRGLAHAELGSIDLAVRDLVTYLESGGTGADAAAVALRLATLRRALG